MPTLKKKLPRAKAKTLEENQELENPKANKKKLKVSSKYNSEGTVGAEGQQVLRCVAKDLEIHHVSVRQANIFHPAFYGNSKIARYRVNTILEDDEHRDFIEMMEEFREKEDAAPYRHCVRAADDKGFAFFLGRSYVNFQTRDKPAILTSNGDLVDLTEELPPKTIVSIKFDLYCYYNIRYQRSAFNLKPTQITIHVDTLGNPITEIPKKKSASKKQVKLKKPTKPLKRKTKKKQAEE